MTSSCPKRRRAKRTPSSILVRTFCLRRCAAISATSPNQDGVEATDSAEVWMITDPSAILVICTTLSRKCFVLPSQRGTFYAGSLLFSSSLRNSWDLPTTSSNSFWLGGSVWQFPDSENADIFVARLVL